MEETEEKPEPLGCIGCVTWDTMVYTVKGVMPIAYISKTHVLTHKGRLLKVEGVSKHPYRGNMIRINPYYSNVPLNITPEHPVLAVRNVRTPQKDLWRKEGFDEDAIEWIEAGKLTNRDFMVFPRVKREKDVKIASPELCELMGWYVAEGYYTRVSRGMNVSFCLGMHEHENIKRVSWLINECLGIKPSLRERGSAVEIILSNN